MRAGRGDERAFAELYDRHAAGLVAFASQYVGDRAMAEDVVQQTFLAAYRTLRDGTELEHPRAWLYHVARNHALTTIRDRGPATVDAELIAELDDRAAAVPARVERRDALQALVRDIAALPPEQRAALALYELGDLSQAEIAETLGCEPARVKALVYQARSSLLAQREARDASCESVREKLATFHGGALNHRLIRHHLRGCELCTAYRDELRDKRRRVALLLPVLPAPGLREAVLGAFGGGGAAAAGKAGALRAPGRRHWLASGAAATAAIAAVALVAWPSAETARKLPASASAAMGPPTHRAAIAPRVQKPVHARRKSAPAHHRAVERKAARPHVRLVTTAAPAPAPRASVPAPRASVPQRRASPPPPHASPPVRPKPPAKTPRHPPPVQPTPTPRPAPPPVTVPPPAVTPSPSPACVDHSNASPQGLDHGKGHHKCK
jgi:RNA polymerase sigma factor (sigma-70 family)